MNNLRSVRVALAATFLFITPFSHAAGPAANAASKAAAPAQVHRVGDQARGFLVKFKPGLSEEQMAGHLAARGLGKAKRFHAPKRAPEAAIGRWPLRRTGTHSVRAGGQHPDRQVKGQ